MLEDRQFLRENGLSVGDQIQLRINAAGTSYETPMKIVGDFRYVPTWYRDPEEEEKPLFVVNLEYSFEQSGGEQPYDVWVKTVPSADFERMDSDLIEVEIAVMYCDAST